MGAASHRSGRKALFRIAQDRRGAAAIELALILGIATTLMLNGVEVARYYFTRMEVENAAQMAAQAVFKACEKQTELPATRNCSDRTGAISRGLASTSLGTGVSLSSSSPSEAYYCVNMAGVLTKVAEAHQSPPANCASAGRASDKPGLYFGIGAQYTFTPIFNGISIGNALPATIHASSLTRLS